MKELIIFNLKRRYLNKITVIINILLLLFIVIMLNSSFFNTDDAIKIIGLDQSMEKYYDSFINNENRYEYQISNNSEIVIHHNDNGFQIVSNVQMEQLENELVKDDVEKAIKRYYQNNNRYLADFLQEYDNSSNIELIIRDKEDQLMIGLVLSAVFFFTISYISLISNEIQYEKNTHVIEMLLTNVSSKQHLASKIIIGYLTPLIQCILIAIYSLIGVLINILFNKGNGDLLLVETPTYIELSIMTIIEIIIVVLPALLIVQLLLLSLISRCKDNEEAASFQSLVYVVCFGLYFILMLLDLSKIIQNPLAKIISIMPIISMYILPIRIALKNVRTIEVIIAIITNILTLIWIYKYVEKKYKENVLSSH